MPAKPNKPVAKVHQLNIALIYTDPPVFRRVQVPSDFTLHGLHVAIQYAMPWEFEHLHAYRIRGVVYGPEEVDLGDFNFVLEDEAVLGDVLPRKGSKGMYEYDFGDGWQHEIRVEGVLPRDPNAHYPVCLEAVGAAPPEDCGGPWGFQRLKEILKKGKGREYKELVEWTGPIFDKKTGELFPPDLDAINKRLQGLW